MSKNLQTINGQNKLAVREGRISECRSSGQNVKDWCKENGVCERKWQRRLFEMAQMQQEFQFAEVTPVRCGNVEVTIRITGAETDVHSETDAATVEAVLRILKLC